MASLGRPLRFTRRMRCYIFGFCINVFLVCNILVHQTWTKWNSALVEKPDSWSRTAGKGSAQKTQGDNEYRVLVSRFRKLMENAVESSNFSSSENDESLELISNAENGTLRFKNRSSEQLFNCQDIENITDKHYIGSGWTKAVYSGVISSKKVAMKTVDIGGQDVTNCVKWGQTLAECYYRAAQKIVKEIVLLQELEHQNLVKVLGYCIPEEQYNGDDVTLVSLITELGDTIDLIKLLPMSWEERLRISYDLTSLIHFFAHSPHGPVVMNDFRHQQFVLVNGMLKLTDVDDTGIGDPHCSTQADCNLHFSPSEFHAKIPCQNGHCVGLNEKKNIFNAGRHFIIFRLPYGAPPSLHPILYDVVSGFTNLTMNADRLLEQMQKAVHLYKTGHYLNRTEPVKTEYKEYLESDLPGKYDYRCRASISGTSCTFTVFDQKEAEDICERDPECFGFVMTQETTWTGRKIVHLKNNMSIPVRNAGTNLYMRPS
ncbi:extracellular tyrosine-protein kinase PKDCC [Octopus bimaculoides]|uniref:Protein kinase domain-containing protein n=1 Tax=Octopus bimaculoides TaxID=37653 RepID=A0A0L8FNF6_OCTBM|nr:extracellular tyrosine-protein kinase PKDCC [Octopus bimaculoides]|eukprot:XP_014788337.1 PREDICTED: extracellular tyrosine-protein kinase PKDCC-like isoform X1 [Octopus bimaculoides]